MNIAGKTILITGANRGIDRVLVDEELPSRVKRVHARTCSAVQNAIDRMTPQTVDMTSVSQIQRVADAGSTLASMASVPDLGVSSDSPTSWNVESTDLIQLVKALETEREGLQMLVCSLLRENEQPRSQNFNRHAHIGARSIR
jgi:NAD(P)-dependent dehydrogenase (short-subunit alcohol dehydrogenase family)